MKKLRRAYKKLKKDGDADPKKVKAAKRAWKKAKTEAEQSLGGEAAPAKVERKRKRETADESSFTSVESSKDTEVKCSSSRDSTVAKPPSINGSEKKKKKKKRWRVRTRS